MLLVGEGEEEKKTGKVIKERKRGRGGREEGAGRATILLPNSWHDSGRSTPTVLSNLHGHRLNIPPPLLSGFPSHFSQTKVSHQSLCSVHLSLR